MENQQYEKPSPETVAKLEQLIEYIEKEPLRFNMGLWGVTAKEGDVLKKRVSQILSEFSPTADDVPPCNTVGCLAGNILVMTGQVKPIKDEETDVSYFIFHTDTPDRAAEWLGIDKSAAARLFLLRGYRNYGRGHWPETFERRLRDATPGTTEYVNITKERIRHFEQTGE